MKIKRECIICIIVNINGYWGDIGRQANVTPNPKGSPSSYVANYRPISITSVLSKVFELLVSVRLGRFLEPSGVLPTTQFAYRKGLGYIPVMHFCACPIHCRVHWRVGRRLGSCRSTSVQPLICSTIWAFSISSALWVLDVLSCLYRHTFYQTDHSKLWFMVVEVNGLMLYQECRSAVFWARYCSSCARQSFFPFWKIS